MKYRTYKFSGMFIAIIGLITLLYAIPTFLRKEIIQSLKSHTDMWMLGYVIIPFLFIVFGMYYFSIGAKQKATNKLISISCILQMIALILGILAILAEIIMNSLGIVTWGFVLLLTGIPIIIFMIIGIVFLILGLSTQKNLLVQ